MATESHPHPVDQQVGVNIRRIRKLRQFSQDKVAQAIGVTFQQLQKYERGSNRVSASKLVEIAAALEVSAADLLEGTAGVVLTKPAGRNPLNDLALTTGGLELASIYTRLTAEQQRSILRVTYAIADVALRHGQAAA